MDEDATEEFLESFEKFTNSITPKSNQSEITKRLNLFNFEQVSSTFPLPIPGSVPSTPNMYFNDDSVSQLYPQLLDVMESGGEIIYFETQVSDSGFSSASMNFINSISPSEFTSSTMYYEEGDDNDFVYLEFDPKLMMTDPIRAEFYKKTGLTFLGMEVKTTQEISSAGVMEYVSKVKFNDRITGYNGQKTPAVKYAAWYVKIPKSITQPYNMRFPKWFSDSLNDSLYDAKL
mgnify:FL=1|jgi:hypothetical protein|tara:strand:- start:679 stop:1374 length:696 start_codon:yes stop_codon:yes gene_type:complete